VSPITIRECLLAFVETIETTGGVRQNEAGDYLPEGDPEWADLGQAYIDACNALKRTPSLGETDAKHVAVETCPLCKKLTFTPGHVNLRLAEKQWECSACWYNTPESVFGKAAT
jgi:hypothetical protein